MFDFDEIIDRRGTHCLKWDGMASRCGVTEADGIPMWVADMDFRAPPAVTEALEEVVARGVFGYHGDDFEYRAAIAGWMGRRHGWEVDPAAILTAHGLVAAVGHCLEAFTAPGEAVVLFTPVYHAFARIIAANGREVVESPLALEDGRYRMDLDALGAGLTGRERMVILCSPHNPGGRIWDREELAALAAFCAERGLILVSDEVHHDIILTDTRHVPLPLAAPGHMDRIVMLTAGSKCFNLAGGMTGNIIAPDPTLRARLKGRLAASSVSANMFGLAMATAAYSGADAWMDALCGYLAGNAQVFDEGVAAIPGVRPMPLDSTYLAWVDFAGTGMERDEFTRRVQRDARIAVNLGPTFGAGGETFLRFNIGTRRALVVEAVERLQEAFSDLQ